MKRNPIIFILSFCIIYFLNISFTTDRGKGVHFVEWKWSDVEHMAKLEDMPIFIFVRASYCMEGDRMEVVFKHKALGEVLNHNFICGKMSTDADVFNNIKATNWGVEHVPTYLFFTTSGKLMYKSEGYKSVDSMLADIQTAREKLVEYSTCKNDKMCDECKSCK